MGLNDDGQRQKLQAYISEIVGSPAEVSGLKKLSGGAIQENWALDIRVKDGAWAGQHALVLRQDSASKVATSLSRAEEYRLLKVAEAAEVLVPGPYFLCEDEAVLGQPFFLMHRLPGAAAGHLLTRGAARPDVVRTLGENLARIHSVLPSEPELSFLGAPPENPALHWVGQYRGYLDAMGAQQPAIEFGLAWLERNAPESGRVTLVHHDYRTGNLMIDGDQLAGILDWEFAGWSDPIEDIAWFCAKCWRFGAPQREAGGLGEREDFYAAYEKQSGFSINRADVNYWEVMAHVRWAVIACQQAARHHSGEETSLELALTGYIVPELEHEILQMTGAG